MGETRSEVVQLLDRLVRFPSLSRREADIATFVEHAVRAEGLQVGRLDDNVHFGFGEGDDCLLLNSHLDVVPPGEGHPFEPFEPVVEGGQMFGRGTVDAKSSVAAMMIAAIELWREGWRPSGGRLEVALTACEELGGEYNGLESLRPHLRPLGAAVVGEPTDLQPCVAQRGLLILRVEAEGRSAHAARAHLGRNAILSAMEDLNRLSAFHLERDDPFLGPCHITVTEIDGGTARNVVPDRCTFTLDIRTTPAYTHDEIVEILSDFLQSTVIVHSKRLVPVQTPLKSRIVEACLRALPGSRPFGSPTMSDWIFLKDVPAVKIGPGSSDRSHTAAEAVSLAEVDRAVTVYKEIVQHYFAGRNGHE